MKGLFYYELIRLIKLNLINNFIFENLLMIIFYIYSDGTYYIGEFEENQRHGRGECHWSDGRVYKGYWKNDKKHGRGTQKFNDRNRKSGTWRNGEIIA